MKRWTIHISLVLILGAATTVGVAWGVAWAVRDSVSAEPPTEFHVRESEDAALYVLREERTSLTLYLVWRTKDAQRRNSELLGTLQDARDALPEWTALREPTEDFLSGQSGSDARWIASFGWPLRAMCTRC
jgi:hypothetical protein